MLSSSTHNHTTWCDGKNTPEEMAEAAWKLGFTDLGFSASGTSWPMRLCSGSWANSSPAGCGLP